MSDLARLDEAIRRATTIRGSLTNSDFDALIDAARSYRDLLAKGQRVEWCEEHRVVQKTSYVEGYDGLRECQDAPYWDGDCRIVSKLLIDPPTEEGAR